MVRSKIVSSVGLVIGALLLGACSRAKVDAVNLANEADKETVPSSKIAKFEQAVALDPENHRIAWKLAAAYRSEKDWAKTASACGKAEAAANSTGNKANLVDNYYFWHGYALEQVAIATNAGPSAWKDAEAPLKAAVELDKNYAQAYEELGHIALRLDDEAGALKYMTQAIETKPDDLQYYAPLAKLYGQLNFPAQEEQVLRAGLTNGKDGNVHMFNLHAMLGHLFEVKGDLPSAITEYEAAKKSCGSCDTHKEAYYYLGAAYALAKDNAKAAQNLQAFNKLACKSSATSKTFEVQCSLAREFATRVNAQLQ